MPSSEYVPLSAAQQSVWYAQQLSPDTPIHIAQYIEIEGPVVPEHFDTVANIAAHEAEAVHIRLVERDGVPYQIIPRDPRASIPLVDFSGEPDPRAAAQAWMEADLDEPIDLMGERLYRMALLRVAADRHLWYLRAHHIAIDGYSGPIINGRMAEIYTALVEGRGYEPKEHGSFRALLAEEADYRRSERFAQDRAYWVERFADRPEAVSLAGAGRTVAPSVRFLRSTTRLPAQESGRLAEASRALRTATPGLTIAAIAAYLSRMTGAQEVILGIAVTGRSTTLARDTPSMMSSILPLRLTVRPQMSVQELVRDVSRATARLLRHQRYRYEDLLRDLKLVGDTRPLYGPVVNIMAFDYSVRFAGHPATAHALTLGLVEDLSI